MKATPSQASRPQAKLSALIAISAGLSFQSSQAATYTTIDGEVSLVAGLTALNPATAINSTNQSLGIQHITDSSWSTGIANLGGVGVAPNTTPNGGTLAGTFGGQTYFSSTNGIILIGVGGASPAWGSWTVRLLLSNDNYSSPISFADNNLVKNSAVLTALDSTFFQNTDGSEISPGAATTYYHFLNIAAFDPSNIGFKGIELSALGASYPDVSYIGVTGAASSAIPEPGTSAATVLLVAGGLFIRNRKRETAA